MRYDCILIPGGGLLSDGSLPPWTAARLQLALEHAADSKRIGLLSGGTVHKAPPLNSQGFPVFESRAAADFLIQQGVQPESLLTEISSYDTIGNAYYSRVLFAEPLKLVRVLVITSDFHMPRTREIFEWIYSLPPLAAPYQLAFESSPDLGLSERALSARKAREASSLAALSETRKNISDLDQFHRWLYTEHKAYAPGKPPGSLSSAELESY